MRNPTRLHYNALITRIAALNGVASAERQFNVIPTVEQRLEDAIRESSAFLSRINMVPVDQIKGENVILGTTGPIAGRTDTSGNGVRQPRDVHNTTAHGFDCIETTFDTFIRYATLDSWAKFPDFQKRFAAHIVQQQGRDRVMIGFNGRSRAATTDRAANPKLQDVNKGWLQKYREDAPERVLSEGAAGAGIVKIGGTNPHYGNLDALVYSVSRELIAEYHQDAPGLVVIVGRKLLDEKYFPMLNQANAPTEQLTADLIVSAKKLGGLTAVQVPFFPDNALAVQPLENLSIYFQTGSRRRFVKEEPEKGRVANYESVNEDYVVEDYERGCVVENIQFGNSAIEPSRAAGAYAVS
jgi:P2 family phage major capsid protein